MRTTIIAVALLTLAVNVAQAVSGLPFQDFSLGPQNQTVDSDFAGSTSAGSMYGLDLSFNGSYLDTLLNGQSNMFRFGDYVGAHTTLSSASYDITNKKYFAGFGFSLGAQAGIALGDYVDVGGRYYLDFRDSKFGSLGNYQTLQLNTAEVMVRVAKIYLSAGTGNGIKGQGETARSSIFHLRYLFSEGGYAGIMIDSLKVTYDLSDRVDTFKNIVLQFGLSH